MRQQLGKRGGRHIQLFWRVGKIVNILASHSNYDCLAHHSKALIWKLKRIWWQILVCFCNTECKLLYARGGGKKTETSMSPYLVLSSGSVRSDCWQCAGSRWKAAEESHRDPIRDTSSRCWDCIADIQGTLALSHIVKLYYHFGVFTSVIDVEWQLPRLLILSQWTFIFLEKIH